MSLTVFSLRGRCDFAEAGRCLLPVGACSMRIETTLFKRRRFSRCNSDDIMLIIVIIFLIFMIGLELDHLLVNLMLLLSVDVLIVFLVLQQIVHHVW